MFKNILGLSGGSHGKESACNAGDLGLIPELGRSPGEGNGYSLQYSCLENFPWSEECGRLHPWGTRGQTWLNEGFPHGSDGKESTCNEGDLGSVPELGRSPGEGNGYPLQCSFLENSMDRGAWGAVVHGVTKSWTRLSNFFFFKQYITYTGGSEVKWSRSVMPDSLQPHGQ